MSKRAIVSVVVPIFNEEESVAKLVEAVREALTDVGDWELLLVDDGSTDATRDIASGMREVDPRVRLIELARNYGQSTAMQAGFDHARGDVVITMDGDLQNDPRDIPMLIDKLGEGYDLVSGFRIRRKDPFLTRKVPSWIANRIIRWITGVPIRDNGCPLKAYRKDLLSRMRLYSEMHRFIPALSATTAGARIAEVGVRHHPRVLGSSKYGLSRVFRVLSDLMTIKMIRTFRIRPLALFSGMAAFAGGMGTLGVGASLLAFGTFQQDKAVSLVFPSIALLWFALAVYLLMLGLVGEIAVREHRARGWKILPIVEEVGQT